jgi:signal transduction histidine kinase
MMYRSINRASEADRHQQKGFLEAALRSCDGDFQRSIQRVLSDFRPLPQPESQTPIESYVAELYSEWRGTTQQPQLISKVSVGRLGEGDEVVYSVIQSQGNAFAPEPWPSALATFGNILKRVSWRRGSPAFFPPEGYALIVSDNVPVIVLPLIMTNLPRPSPSSDRPQRRRPQFGSNSVPRPGRIRSSGSPRGLESPPPFARSQFEGPGRGRRNLHLVGWCFLQLNLEYLRGQLLPELVQRHFMASGLSDYQIGVVTGNPRYLIFRSSSSLKPEDVSSVDASMVLISPRFHLGLGFGNSNRGSSRSRSEEEPAVGEGSVPGLNPMRAAARIASNEAGSADWLLVARHQAGSLNVVVNRARERNLAIGFGILLLLAANTFLLLMTTQRWRALAQQQMEFVAGVSHELYTPLAVIQSASFNLVKGVIQEPSKVRQYGLEIQAQGRRLIEMVQQILTYAAIQSGHKQYDLKPVRISEVVDLALKDCESELTAENWRVEKDIEQDLPWVMGDAKALEGALKNLFHNALKYAREGKWLCITARTNRNKKNPEVEVTVADRGPGIDAVDLPRIFEPFYRSLRVTGTSTPGAGLGLSLVQRHLKALHGRVTVESSAGKGAAFTLHLPVSTAPGSESTV